MGLGALLKTVAESTQLRTVDDQAVLDKVHITLERAVQGNRIHMPQELLRRSPVSENEVKNKLNIFLISLIFNN